MATLALSRIAKTFGSAPVLRGIDLSIGHGEFVAVVGPSGCGKSTLLRLIAGLDCQDAGTIHIDGIPVDGTPPKERDIAMVFQSYALYPHMTVAQNIALPLVMRDLTRVERLPLARHLLPGVARKRAAITSAVEEAADYVALRGYLGRKPKELSGGQRQRVALARALVRKPRLFLLDEPLSNLDAALRASTRTEIVALQKRLQITTVYVTHDQVEAMTMADRIVVLMDGAVLQVGSPKEIYDAPADIRVARFIGTPPINLLAGEIIDGFAVLAGSRLPIRVPGVESGTIRLGIRAEHVNLTGRDEGMLMGTVTQKEFLGSEELVHVALERGRDLVLIARHQSELPPPTPGSVVGVQFASDRILLFNADGKRIPSSPAIASPAPLHRRFAEAAAS
ncbi:ABC transporter ATP-binding protein [Rhodoligotrophos defluvii]|uniref:ABC transporter ATP-binding protein n=1 Tax=Rhodoligotrophos defluvii TaxID=2561934 RepID=UPI0010C9D4F4|nr:ABC transporter ATP-binding protein [Rhodoligotrophos defluvii]